MAEVHREHHQPGESAPVRQQVEKDHVAERRGRNRTRQSGEDQKMRETVYGIKAKTTGGAQRML